MCWRVGWEPKEDQGSRASHGRESGAHTHHSPAAMLFSRAVISVQQGESGSALRVINSCVSLSIMTRGTLFTRMLMVLADSKSEILLASLMNTVVLLRVNVPETGHPLLVRASPLPEQPAFSPDLVLVIFFTGLLLQDVSLCCLMEKVWAVNDLRSQSWVKSCLYHSLAL